MNATDPCPCCSGKAFSRCCGPFLDGKAAPRTVKQLMRSRYSAYALGGNGPYLLATWHPDHNAGLTADSLSAASTDWQELSIIDSRQQADEGVVEFEARYLDAKGETRTHHETSQFVRLKGKWLYVRAISYEDR